MFRLMEQETTDIELLYLFGGRRLLIFAGIALYLIAAVSLFLFIPETVDWLRADTRRTVEARVVSSVLEHDASGEEEYRVTLEYAVNGMKKQHVETWKHMPSGKQKLHVYCTRDGRWEVMNFNIGGILFLIALSAASALHGTHMFVAAKKRKQAQTGESV